MPMLEKAQVELEEIKITFYGLTAELEKEELARKAALHNALLQQEKSFFLLSFLVRLSSFRLSSTCYLSIPILVASSSLLA